MIPTLALILQRVKNTVVSDRLDQLMKKVFTRMPLKFKGLIHCKDVARIDTVTKGLWKRSETHPGQAHPTGDFVGDVLPVDVSYPGAGGVLHAAATHPHLQRRRERERERDIQRR